MNVAELIAALQAVEDQTLPVSIEGCDCNNPAKGVFVEHRTVYIEADLS